MKLRVIVATIVALSGLGFLQHHSGIAMASSSYSYNFNDCADACGSGNGGITETGTETWNWDGVTITNPGISFSNIQGTGKAVGVDAWHGCTWDGNNYRWSCGINLTVSDNGSGFNSNQVCWYDRLQINGYTGQGSFQQHVEAFHAC
jgi:hypothetical protein